MAQRGAREVEPAALKREVINLDDNTVDLMLNVMAILAVASDIFLDAVEIAIDGNPVRNRKTPFRELLISLRLSVRLRALQCANPCTTRRRAPSASVARAKSAASRSTRSWARVRGLDVGGRDLLEVGANLRKFAFALVDPLTKISRRRIPRVGKWRQPKLEPLVVDRTELSDWEVNLSADLKQFGDRRTISGGMQPQRDVGHMPNVGSDVFTDATVTAGGKRTQLTLVEYQVNCETINLQLTQQLGDRSSSFSTRAAQALNSSTPNALSKLIIRTRCSTGSNISA